MASPKEKSDDQTGGSDSGSLNAALLRELRENSVALATFSAEQRALKEKVQTLTAMLKSDDPANSFLTRFTLLEYDVIALKKSSDKVDDKLDKLNDTSQTFIIEDRKDVRESNRQRMQVWIAVITALAGAAIAIITTIWAHK